MIKTIITCSTRKINFHFRTPRTIHAIRRKIYMYRQIIRPSCVPKFFVTNFWIDLYMIIITFIYRNWVITCKTCLRYYRSSKKHCYKCKKKFFHNIFILFIFYQISLCRDSACRVLNEHRE